MGVERRDKAGCRIEVSMRNLSRNRVAPQRLSVVAVTGRAFRQHEQPSGQIRGFPALILAEFPPTHRGWPPAEKHGLGWLEHRRALQVLVDELDGLRLQFLVAR